MCEMMRFHVNKLAHGSVMTGTGVVEVPHPTSQVYW